MWSAIVILALACGPLVLGPGALDRLTILFVYVILAAMWNALAGYAGLVSVGQQLFLGLGAYFTIRLADAGLDPFVSMVAGRLHRRAHRGAAVVPDAAAARGRVRHRHVGAGANWRHLLVNLDTLIKGETGTSLIALNAYRRDDPRRHHLLAGAGRHGAAARRRCSCCCAAASAPPSRPSATMRKRPSSVGVRVLTTKRLIYVFAAFGAALAGALWLATALTFQPKAYFSVNWTAYMIFMVLVGGIGTFEGAILGALLFFVIETWFGALGVWYLVGLGATALLFALLLPKGIWGAIEKRWGLRLLPVGYRLDIRSLIGRTGG